MLKLKDIAKQAGVSSATVSLVLNNRAGVSAEKRAFITQLLKENNYIINSSENEPRKKIRFIKFSKHSFLVNGNPGFVNHIMDAVEEECRARNIDLMITTADINSFGNKELQALYKSNPVDGMIVLGTEMQPEDIAIVKGISCPIVVVDNSMEYIPFSCVTMNNSTTIRNVILYLYSIGHRRIGFLANRLPSCNCTARRKTFEATTQELGLDSTDLIYEVTPSLDGAFTDINTMLRQGVKFPAAIVSNNDCIAIGAMRAFKEFGIDIPGDISIFGFDDIDFSAVSTTPLSTNRVSCKDMGFWAVRLVCDQMERADMSTVKIHLNTSMIHRKSVIPFRPDGSYHPSVLV